MTLCQARIVQDHIPLRLRRPPHSHHPPGRNRRRHRRPQDHLRRVRPAGHHANELGDTTRYDYEDHGTLTKITDPLGRITQASHTGDGQPRSVTDSAGKVSTNTYRLGDLVTTTDSLGNTTRLFHDAAGRVTSTTAPNGATATYAAGNQLITNTDPLGHTFSRAYQEDWLNVSP
ncbi:hypothetical protein GCM10022254_64340 [Actinomadura meridiana]|uniref:RHS repeat protein n=1 Tax=Actinomadura meridiana TaxID=559626 RepID=A0ABP8CJZ9_9ACTN